MEIGVVTGLVSRVWEGRGRRLVAGTRLWPALLLLLSACGQSMTEAEVARLADAYLATAASSPPQVSQTLSARYRFQDDFVGRLVPVMGPRVGVKAGLTSVPAQRRFGASAPVMGWLLGNMLVESPATIPVAYAARPMVEADLLVRVRDAGIATADTHAELMAHLDQVIPFLELPDLVYGPGSITAADLVAVNAGARLGVTGKPIAVREGVDWPRRLARFQVVLYGAGDVEVVRGSGESLLGHPLEVVRWLRDQRAATGRPLQAGELLSLGSLTPLQAVSAGDEWRAVYSGLFDGKTMEVRASFH